MFTLLMQPILWQFACNSKEATSCESNDDCLEGVCAPDGQCIVVEDTGVDVDSESDTDSGTDTGLDGALCIPNDDGRIDWSEYPSSLDLSVPFYYAAGVEIDLTGNQQSAQPSGEILREWDFSEPVSGQTTVLVETPAPQDFWFADSFPTSSYVTILSRESELYGVFSLSETGLFLDGVASFEGGWTETLLVYDPPAQVLDFPFEQGYTWSTESVVTGTLNGVYSYHVETQTVTVDARGHIEAPIGRFPVLRLHTQTNRQVGLLTYLSQSMSFVSECYGIVTAAASEMDEQSAEFTEAFELLRMAPQ